MFTIPKHELHPRSRSRRGIAIENYSPANDHVQIVSGGVTIGYQSIYVQITFAPK